MATVKDEFEAIRNNGSSRGQCHFCEENAVAHVEIRARERGGSKKQIATRTISACGPHTVELYKDLEKQFERKR